MDEININHMLRALELADIAKSHDEVPIGAVIVHENQIIAEGYNLRETEKNALLHAELIAVNAACKKLNGWRLHKCDIYVTVEPCPMCAGAIINSRLKRVIFGAKDPKAGAFGSVINLNEYDFNHKPELIGGVCEEESAELLKSFFTDLRNKTKRHS